MNRKYRMLALLLAIVMTLASAAGCSQSSSSSSASDSSSQSDSSSESESSSAATSDYDYSQYLDDNGYWKKVKATKYVTLGTYKGIVIPAETSVVTDEQVQAQIDSIMADYGETNKLTDPNLEIKDGDTVNIDFVGTIDGVEFENGSTNGAGYDVTIGTTEMIDDFVDQLKGHKPGENFDIEVTFPDDYGSDTLNGKDAVFNITINYIKGDDIYPELTDAFVTEKLKESYGWDTVGGMKQEITDNLRKTAENEYLWSQIKDTSTVADVPDTLLTFQEETMIAYFTNYATSYGIDLATYLSYMGFDSEDALKESYHDDLVSAAEESLLVQAIAEKAKLKASDDDVSAYFKDYMNTDDYSDYESFYGMPYLKMVVLNNKVMDYMRENAVRDTSTSSSSSDSQSSSSSN